MEIPSVYTRAEIIEAVREYLDRGGKITQLPYLCAEEPSKKVFIVRTRKKLAW